MHTLVELLREFIVVITVIIHWILRHCYSEKTASESRVDELQEVISHVSAEISHIESVMSNELWQGNGIAKQEHTESAVQLPGDSQ